jgi:hypothetical protein
MSDDHFRFSEAITRAGLAALAASAFALPLVQRLQLTDSLEAFGSYVLARESLTHALFDVDTSPFKDLISEKLRPNEKREGDITVAELLPLTCIESNAGLSLGTTVQTATVNVTVPVPDESNSLPTDADIPGKDSLLNDPSAGRAKVDSSAVAPMSPVDVSAKTPKPPSGLTVSLIQPCPGVQELTQPLATLFNDQLLERARNLHNDFEMQIYRWELARWRVESRAALQMNIGTRPVSLDGSERYRNLTIEEIRSLAKEPAMTLAGFSTAVKDTMNVQAPYGSASISANTAGLLTEIAILIFTTYFCFVARTGVEQRAFEGPSTLFSIYSWSRSAKTIFVTLAFTPSIAAISLAMTMRGTNQSIAIFLMSVSFFSTLNIVDTFFKITNRSERKGAVASS